jgi:peptidoglycan/xylan/chitin deacetylase (PgdA/CDA1 family)
MPAGTGRGICHTKPRSNLAASDMPGRRALARTVTRWTVAVLAAALCAAALASPVLGAHPAQATLVFHGPRTAKVIALTFDDGWGVQATGEIFGILQRQHVAATFFPVAVDVERAPALWRAIAAAGYPIGNHTKNHPDLTRLPAWRVRAELHAAQAMIESVTGRPMLPVFRPPYGAWNETVLQAAHDVGFDTALLWDVASADTARHSAWLSILGNALGGRSGSIVLMHAGPSVTPSILDQVIDTYRSRGYRFVTVPQLLGMSVASGPSTSAEPAVSMCLPVHARSGTGPDGGSPATETGGEPLLAAAGRGASPAPTGGWSGPTLAPADATATPKGAVPGEDAVGAARAPDAPASSPAGPLAPDSVPPGAMPCPAVAPAGDAGPVYGAAGSPLQDLFLTGAGAIRGGRRPPGWPVGRPLAF